jgi:phage head maturation protease
LPAGGERWDPPAENSSLRQRTLKDIELHEVSVAAIPAYPETTVALRSLRAVQDQSNAIRQNIRQMLISIGKS